MTEQLCSICREPFEGGNGYDADPIHQGRCCAACNWARVVPARLVELREQERQKLGVGRWLAAVSFF
jgi:hypothetical protein